MLNHYVERGAILINNIEIPLKNLRFNAIGFETQEAMLPYPTNANLGNRLLQEYFCFPEGFLFLGIQHENKNIFPTGIQYNSFTLKVDFSRSLPKNLRLRKNTIRINCVPAVNLFHHDGEPITLNGKKTQYPLVPSYRHSECYEIFSVEQVESGQRSRSPVSKNNGYIYTPFNSFEHQHEFSKGQNRLYYNLKQTQDELTNQIRHWISFIRGDEE